MTDIKLTCTTSPASPALFDIFPDGDGLELDDGLQTAVIISLFTDRRAEDDDELPGGDDRRGWWADSYADVEGDKLGSRLWLLSREKQVNSVLEKARVYAEEALQWMIEDGVAETVSVETAFAQSGMLAILIKIFEAADSGVVRYGFLTTYASGSSGSSGALALLFEDGEEWLLEDGTTLDLEG